MFVVYVILTNGEENYYREVDRWGDICLTDDLSEAKKYPTITIAQVKAEQLRENKSVLYAEGVYIECKKY